jgi:uncharacterized protein YuzE
MKVTYNKKHDLLYNCLDPTQKEVRNQEVSEHIVLDLDAEDRIVGIEILNASTRLNADSLLPVEYEQTA